MPVERASQAPRFAAFRATTTRSAMSSASGAASRLDREWTAVANVELSEWLRVLGDAEHNSDEGTVYWDVVESFHRGQALNQPQEKATKRRWLRSPAGSSTGRKQRYDPETLAGKRVRGGATRTETTTIRTRGAGSSRGR